MSPATYSWLKAFHAFGFLLWTAGLFATLRMLAAHGLAGTAAPVSLAQGERRTAVFMDIGATIAIVAGLALTFMVDPSPLTQGGWLHAKLTLVLAFLALHVVARLRIKKFRNGEVKPLPGALLPVLLVLAFAIVVLAKVRPF